MTDVQFSPNWTDEATKCKNCGAFQTKDGKNACVPPEKSFEDAIKEYGEITPDGHCNLFQAKQ